jgi:acetyl esterase/lipase
MKNICNSLILLLVSCVVLVNAQTLTVRQMMAEPSIAGQRVSGEKLSPDGTKVAFLWNEVGKMPRDLYLVDTAGGPPAKILKTRSLPVPAPSPTPDNKLNYGVEVRDQFVRDRENQLGSVEWSPDSKRLIFTHSGDVYVLTVGENTPKRFTKTQMPEFGARFLDNDRILYMQGGNVFVLDTANSTITQLTREANTQQFRSVGAVTPSKDGKMLAYTVSDGSKQRQLIVPNFLPEFVTAGGPRRGWTEQRLFVTPTDGSRDTPFEIKLPKPEGVSSFRRMVWAADNRSLIIDRLDIDTKRRQLFYIYNVGAKNEQIILITEDTDDKWQAPLSAIFEPRTDVPEDVLFASEHEGYNHLYLASLEMAEHKQEPNPTGEVRAEIPSGPSPTGKVNIKKLTAGNREVGWAKWANFSTVIVSSTKGNTAERQFSCLSPDDVGMLKNMADAEHTLTSPAGMKSGMQLEQSTLLYESSEWDRPGDLHAQTRFFFTRCVPNPQPPVKLTNTVPADFARIRWTEPKFIEIPSRDGKIIPAKIYLPAGHDPKKKYPMAIFVHGAGYLQNVINGWNNYYREFMFNDMLAKKGYVVLDIDYRGSAGYGRDWRTDVHAFLGGKDFDDHIDSIDHMVANYGVDQKRIGVYGGSYGGFMAGMLAMRAPNHIAAAAALRPVFDWKNYYAANPNYTTQRLGFPDKNPEAYRRSSPITYADRLERPLLILHGMVDDNVHVQDSVQLIEKLIRLEKTQYFEAMLYPSENHAFVRPESWADEYERILGFFDKHLMGR